MELKNAFHAVFITLIFILASFQAAYAIGEDFTYDANGNMIQGPGGLYYEYNDANQLKRVRDGGPTGEVIAEYWYDYTGKRIKKNENGVVTYYITDSFEQIVYPNGTVVNITYYIANDERLAKKVSTASGDKMYYFHPDHLGSTSIVSDENGNLVEKTEYYPYGGVKQGGEAEKYLFTGKELDKATGLYDYGARQYHPDLARFVQPDNIIQDPYDPQSLNRYAYTRNNPVKYTDPSGNAWILVKTAARVAFKGGNVGLAVQDFRDAGNAIVDAIKDPTQENIKNAAVKTFGAVVLSKGDIKEIKGGMSKLRGMGEVEKDAAKGAKKVTTNKKNEKVITDSETAEVMVEKFKGGKDTRPIFGIKSGKPKGEITLDEKRVIRDPHTDPGTPELHYNLQNKETGTNIHIITKDKKEGVQ